MFKLLALLAVCLAATHPAAALDCYNCTPSSQCKEVESLTPMGCGSESVPPYKPACQTLTLKKKGTDNVEYLRRCVVAVDEGDKSQCQPLLGYELTECKVCFEDRCNSAESVKIGLSTVAAALCAIVLGRIV